MRQAGWSPVQGREEGLGVRRLNLRRENRDLITTMRNEAPGHGATKRNDILTCNVSVCMLRTDYRRGMRDISQEDLRVIQT